MLEETSPVSLPVTAKVPELTPLLLAPSSGIIANTTSIMNTTAEKQ